MRTILLGAAAAVALSATALAQGNPGGDAGRGSGQQPPIMSNPGGAGAGGQRMQGGAEAPRATPDAPRRGDAAQRQPIEEGQGQRRMDQGGADRAADTQREQRRDSAGDQRRDAAGERRDERPTASGNVGTRTRISITAPRQKTVIKNNIVRTSVAVPAGVTIAVGSVLPATIAFQPVPAVIVAEVPELEPYYYVVVDGQIVFVDPSTYAIVYVMPLA